MPFPRIARFCGRCRACGARRRRPDRRVRRGRGARRDDHRAHRSRHRGYAVQFAGGQVGSSLRTASCASRRAPTAWWAAPLRLPGQPAGPPTAPSPGAPSRLSAGAGRLWAFGGSRVYRIDPRRGVVTGTIRLGRKGGVCVRDVAARGGSVYALHAAADRPGQTAPPAARLVRFNARTLAAGFRFPRAALKNAATVQVHPTGVIVSSFPFGQAAELTRLGRRGTKDRSVVVEIWAPALTRGAPGCRATRTWPASTSPPSRTTGMSSGRPGDSPWPTRSGSVPSGWPRPRSSLARAPRDRHRARRSSATRCSTGPIPSPGRWRATPIRLPQPAAAMVTGAARSGSRPRPASCCASVRPAPYRRPRRCHRRPSPPLLGGPTRSGHVPDRGAYEVPLDITLAEGGWLYVDMFGWSGPLGDQVVTFQRSRLAHGIVRHRACGRRVRSRRQAGPHELTRRRLAAWQANPALVVTVVGPTTVGGRPGDGGRPQSEEAPGRREGPHA